MRRFRGCQLSLHLNSLIFTKAWSIKAWIPVVSSSLYFWKSAFSFRADSILKWRVYIKLKVSWLRAFLWCMSQTSRDRVNARRVRTHEKNSGDAVRRLGTKHFLCPIRSQHSLDRLEMVRWESVTQGLFRLCLKTFVAPFLPPDWPPLGLRGWGVPGIHSLLPLQAFYVNPARFALTKGPRSRRQFPILQLSW